MNMILIYVTTENIVRSFLTIQHRGSGISKLTGNMFPFSRPIRKMFFFISYQELLSLLHFCVSQSRESFFLFFPSGTLLFFIGNFVNFVDR
jgi:hypothetical protein